MSSPMAANAAGVDTAALAQISDDVLDFAEGK